MMEPHLNLVNEYFTQTHNDYRRFWGIDRHGGMHCGYFDEERRTHDAAVTHMNQVLANLGAIQRSDHVLDAGCGVGGSAFWLADHIGCPVTGINICMRQLEQAREAATASRRNGNPSFKLTDYCRSGFEDESFDVVWALESMCYAQEKSEFLAEAYRLLRPGGRLILADGFLSREDLTTVEERIVERWRDGWAIPNVLSVNAFSRLVTEAGFHEPKMLNVTSAVAPSSRRVFLGTLAIYPIALALYWMRLRTRVQTRGIASGYYQWHARRRGLGVYMIVLAEKPHAIPETA